MFSFLQQFSLREEISFFPEQDRLTRIESITVDGREYPKFINEFWTSRQRQASSIHEISYRACFKAQLPRFFIALFSQEGDTVYDPFSGRGTTVIEAGLMGRQVISNDVNPLSEVLCRPRFFIPEFEDLEKRLGDIPLRDNAKAEMDLSMFYDARTERELVSLREYLWQRKESGDEDHLDDWIRMVATNRLSGHSPGFFSVYTLPPNQAVSPEDQIRINRRRGQAPEYRDVKKLILVKSEQLLSRLPGEKKENLRRAAAKAQFLTEDARYTNAIPNDAVRVTVTSPPFLDVVHYVKDNWLRCWFNTIDVDAVAEKITMAKTLEAWSRVMTEVFEELFRITAPGGWVAFEVGEIKKGKINLDEHVVPLGLAAGFQCEGIVINEQYFTKTSNIWGISNKERGTNTNRIVLLHKV